ncbi:lactonase family protein [Streptomyces sp. NBC_01190]|uniref:lactonase family protein n=1 Tax=Streptomyces sp. NBC_01190 TaxID=2903767 RepID=UPI00386BB6F1|nr:lactonase family protein [Streptomyces sp. NBC_01190]
MGTKHNAVRIAGAAIAAAASLAVFAGPASAHTGNSGAPVFVQTDGVAGNTIVAYSGAADGTLTQQGVYATGGRGGKLDGAVVDSLASEGSLTYDRAHSLLYAVNAGSDTVTVFSVRGDRLARRQVIASGGDFPVSVAVHGDQVYVLNALGGGSVQGYLNVGGFLVKVPSWHRDLGLDPDAAPQFTHTPGQVGFTPDGSKLVVTTKAGGNTIDVFSVGLLGLSAKPVVTATPDAVPFGFTFDAAGRLVVTEAGPNAVATFTVGRDGRLAKVSEVATGQAATCWVVRDGATLYASNAGSGTLSGLRAGADGSLRALGTTSTAAGTVDAAVTSDGKFLYAQTGGAGGVDGFRVNPDGSLAKIASVTVPDAVAGEGIVAL